MSLLGNSRQYSVTRARQYSRYQMKDQNIQAGQEAHY